MPRFVAGEAAERRDTVASAIRIAEPVHRGRSTTALERSGGAVVALTDEEIARRLARARPRGGRLLRARLAPPGSPRSTHAGLAPGSRVVCVVTGHGLKDPRPRLAATAAGPVDPTRTRSRRRAMIVRAPATTANLGPGFDCAGGALDLWNELEVSDGRRRRRPRPPRRARVRAPRAAGRAALPRSPTASRASAGSARARRSIALGLVAGATSPATSRDAEELLAPGVELEGHADNLAAALAGGVCLTWDARIARVADDAPAAPIAVVPDYDGLDRRVARARCRETVAARGRGVHRRPRGAPRRRRSRPGRRELFAAALDDRLHEPYRGATRAAPRASARRPARRARSAPRSPAPARP